MISKDGSLNELLLLLLSKKGQYVSGEEISARFGVSRTAIWKQVNHLRQVGYEIDSLPRVGYCLKKSPDLLLPEEIIAKSKLTFLGRKIYYYPATASTNEEAKKLAGEGAHHGSLVIAEEQTGGKGRMGRVWLSPPRVGIWMSIILRPVIQPYEAPRITMTGAVAAAKAIRERTGVTCHIKWPNDILVEGKKVAGILTEMSADIDGINYVVMGIGINVNNDDFPGELKEIATSLKIAKGEAQDRLDILTGFLFRFEDYYNCLEAGEFKKILEEWRLLCCNLGRRVRVVGRNFTVEGIALDVDDDGALLVRSENGRVERILSGDVSLRA
ncbi:biotin--[acetyl-CoA-carboxylase] ligase [Thermosediminibacter oceani]|uniref:Bifunctional ligase/repressor BirA n=1 Tax=Thermosediminibacter oceani (strain ATCC BAA-1034 / DSM 16646 / JW/IW-1228P) TaxID=555079 RepID=D9S2M2_THEOJ|nr:biotin--[acetyl-CoA-carboxylase] ligase [Thermosediminibacter oceani]ADL07649.1 biotin/acetyl-CoA-carboxylase ligase [Thermosediminibacter oceani DSM 16646]